MLSGCIVSTDSITFIFMLLSLVFIVCIIQPEVLAHLLNTLYLADAIGAGCFVAHEAATMWEFSKLKFVGGLQSLG